MQIVALLIKLRRTSGIPDLLIMPLISMTVMLIAGKTPYLTHITGAQEQAIDLAFVGAF